MRAPVLYAIGFLQCAWLDAFLIEVAREGIGITVSEQDPPGPRCGAGIDKGGPIRMIRNHEATVIATAAAIAAHPHPPRAESSRVLAEATHPRRAGGARRRQDQGAPVVCFLVCSDGSRGQHRDPRSAVYACEGVNSAVYIHRLIGEGAQFGQNTLCLPE